MSVPNTATPIVIRDHPHSLSGPIVDLDQNENPLGAPPEAIRLLQLHASGVNEYPDGSYEEATLRAADYYGLRPEEVFITEGVDEAVDLALLHTGAGTSFTPGYWPYWERADALSIPMRRLKLNADWQPDQDVDQIQGTMLIAHPNNPTGNLISDAWIDAALERSELVFLDESYLDFSSAPSRITAIRTTPNLCVFRSFSKAFGLAGLRLGVILADQRLVSKLAKRRRIHETIALYGLIGALKESAFIHRTVEYVVQARPRYVGLLRRHERLFPDVRDTSTNFVVARCAAPWTDETMSIALAHAGVKVRRCSIMELQNWIRVSVGPPEALSKLEIALTLVDAYAQRGT